MTEAKKAREFWINGDNYNAWVGKPNAQDIEDFGAFIHVIEYSALQALIDENAKLVEKLRKAEDVIRKMMLRLEVIETFKCHNTLGKSRCNIENTQSIKAARAYLKEQGE